MKQESKFNFSDKQQQGQNLGQEQGQQHAPLEFATPEELLRRDALHTPVPPTIACRLQDSINSTAPNRPWWRRWFPG